MKKEKLNIKETDEEKIIRSQMEKMVGSYDKYMRRITLGQEADLRKMTVSLAQIKQGDCVLEVGCGTGTLTLEAKRQAGLNGQVFGIDIIPGMAEASRNKAEQANLDVSFQIGSIESIQFSDANFDVVILSFMIFHMSEKFRVFGLPLLSFIRGIK